MNTTRIIRVACLAAVLVSPGLRADDGGDNRLRDQVRQAVMEKRRLEDENFQLKAQLAAAQADAAKVKATPAPPKVSPELLKLRQETVRQNDQRVALQADLEIARADLEKAKAELAQTGAALRDLQDVRTRQSGQLQASSQREKACIDLNGKLSALNGELMDQYREEGFWQALREHETVTGLYRVKVENLMQDYRQRLQDATLPPPAPEAATPPAPDAASAASASRNTRRLPKAENT